MPGDSQSQLAVVRATLQALVEIDQPGGVRHLPFEWPEPPAVANPPLAELPPIYQYLRKHISHVRTFMNHEIPEEFRVR